MTRIAVIGGGLAGLSAAYTLTARYHDVVLLEAGDKLGGQIESEQRDGYVVDLGAEGFVARSQAVPEMARALGIEEDLRGQSVTRSLGYRAGVLKELAPGEAASFLGFQVPRDDMGQGIRTFVDGMGSLTTRLAKSLVADVEIHTGWAVSSLDRKANSFRVGRAEGRPVEVERVVLATSSKSAAKLLAGVVGSQALQLSAAQTTSSVTVSLAYDRASIAHPLDATGFVVASEDQIHGIRAVTFVSSKFERRSPDGKALLRVFFRPSDVELKQLGDAAFSERAAAFLAQALGISAPPEHAWVSRWGHALPVFDAEHQARVQALNDALHGNGIALAGSAFFGAGIDAALRSGMSIAERF